MGQRCRDLWYEFLAHALCVVIGTLCLGAGLLAGWLGLMVPGHYFWYLLLLAGCYAVGRLALSNL